MPDVARQRVSFGTRGPAARRPVAASYSEPETPVAGPTNTFRKASSDAGRAGPPAAS